MFGRYTKKFIDFTVSSDKTINQNIIDYVDGYTPRLNIEGAILEDIGRLIEKAILNKLSSDLLFQKNYWFWGFVTIYYSNFYLAQILNKVSNKFFVYARENINKEIVYDSDLGSYTIVCPNGENTHKRKFKLLKANYSFLKTLDNSKLVSVLNSIKVSDRDTLFKYTIDNDIKESEIRNKINYQLRHYKELHLSEKQLYVYKKWHNNILENKLSTHYPDYFKLLIINEKRFLFASLVIKELLEINYGFRFKLQTLSNSLKEKEDKFFHKVDIKTKKLINEVLQ